MEHAQRVTDIGQSHQRFSSCLNPYFNGTCSKSSRFVVISMKDAYSRLNPYFNGTCSKRGRKRVRLVFSAIVLILILMEHAQRDDADDTQFMTPGLNPYFNGTCSKSEYNSAAEGRKRVRCLNPYFNGTCSKSPLYCTRYKGECASLNPYFNGTCSKSKPPQR